VVSTFQPPGTASEWRVARKHRHAHCGNCFIVAVGLFPVVAKRRPPAVKPAGGHAVKAGPAAVRAPKTTTRTVKPTRASQGAKRYA
jgi:hypothetical protein